MIPYSLALELKNNGFPQKGKGTLEHIWGQGDGEYYIPTLEELIEACGDEFLELRYYPNDPTKWRALDETGMDPEFGDTPIEAVANLWLALNKK